jgi:transposase-like protein
VSGSKFRPKEHIEMAKNKGPKRYTEEEKRAAVADLANMTADEVARKHNCSAGSLWTWKKKYSDATKPRARRTGAPSTSPDRVVELEAHVAELEAEGGRLRRLLLDGFMQNEQNSKLRRIAQIARDGGPNQVKEIMEALLAPETPGVAERTNDAEVGAQTSQRKRAH